jgi:AAA ATPase domain
LLGAVQTSSFPFSYTPNGTYVNLGDFRELARGHNKLAHFEIGLRGSSIMNTPYAIAAEYKADLSSLMPRLVNLKSSGMGFELNVAATAGEQYDLTYRYDKAKDPADANQQVRELSAVLERLFGEVGEPASTEAPKGKSRKKTSPTGKKTNPFQGWDAELSKGQVSFRDLHSLVELRGDNLPFRLRSKIRELSTYADMGLKNFNYIGAFRIAPQRTYYQTARTDLKVGIFGENYIDQIAEWEYRKAVQLTWLQQYTRKLGLASGLKTTRMGGGRFDVVVRTSARSVRSSLIDVGFGVSQFLPILVADLQLGAASTLALSQPEIHLHPSIQAESATYFADRVTADSKRYIIETHSEYLINRFRLLIAEGVLKPSDVSVVFLQHDGKTSKLHHINLRENGTIEGAPPEFFATYMMDVMNLAMAV